MPKERQSKDAPGSWTTSKCLRSLRPLRLKITALERALSASQFVADGLTPWSSLVPQRRSKVEQYSDSSTDFRPRQRKYGDVRRQRHVEGDVRNDPRISTDELLSTLRQGINPSLGSAYLGVYYAFLEVLGKRDVGPKFPSLAVRAALVVGRCAHLASELPAEEYIEPDDWYDAVPAHLRPNLTLGHATQLLIASSGILRPLLPIMVLMLRHTPLATDVMRTLLEHTDFSHCRKADVEFLQKLAVQASIPWVIKVYFTQNFHLEYLKLPACLVILDTRSDAPIDDFTQALYMRAISLALQNLRKKNVAHQDYDARYLSALQDMTRRILQSAETWVLAFFQELFEASAQHPVIQQISLAHSLALLVKDTSNLTVVHKIQVSMERVLESASQDKHDCLDYLTTAFEPEALVKVVECLIGRIDVAAIALARACATAFEGEFHEWADNIENDISQTIVRGADDRYRFEPLLDSWVARTPGVKKVQYGSKVKTLASDEEEATCDSDEEVYHADHSRSQLSLVEQECEEEEDDLLMTSRSLKQKVPEKILQLLSARKVQDSLSSVKVRRHIVRLSSGSMQRNTKSVQTWEESPIRVSHRDPDLSPTLNKGTRRKHSIMLDGQAACSPPRRRKRVKHHDAQPRQKLSDRGQREVARLRTGFAAWPRKKSFNAAAAALALAVTKEERDELSLL